MSKVTTLYVYKHLPSGTNIVSYCTIADPSVEFSFEAMPKHEHIVITAPLYKDYGTGLSVPQMAYRYSQIHKAVEDMGGFANFSAWTIEHAKDYFASLEKSLSIIDLLLKGNKSAKEKAEQFLKRYLEDIQKS